MCVSTRRVNGGPDSLESSPYVTLSRGAFSASSLVSTDPEITTPDRVVPVCNSDLYPCRLPRTLPRAFSSSPRSRGSPMTVPSTRRKPASSPTASAKQTQAQAQRQAYQRRKTRAKANSEALRQKEAAPREARPVQRPHAAGIDSGSRCHGVCVGFSAEADAGLIGEFPAHSDGLKAMVAFLREHPVNTVAMASTGIYGIALYELRAAEGFEVLLVDPRSSQPLRGRPKTDRRDCPWIYRLHSVGLPAEAAKWRGTPRRDSVEQRQPPRTKRAIGIIATRGGAAFLCPIPSPSVVTNRPGSHARRIGS